MPRTIRATDLFDLRFVGTVSASGDDVAYTVTWPDEETDENRSTIHLFDGGSSRQLTDGHRDASLSFSPTGDRLAFLRSEPKSKPKPAIVDVASGEVTMIDGYDEDAVILVEWIDDDRLLVLATRRPAELVGLDADEIARRPLVTDRLDYRFNGRGTTLHARVQVEIVSLGDGSIQRLSTPGIDHGSAAASPDGSAVIVTAASDEDADLTGRSRIWLLPVDGSEPTLLTPTPGSWGDVGFTSDGRPWASGVIDPDRPSLSRPHLLVAGSEPAVLGPYDVNCSAAIGGGAQPRIGSDALYMPGIRGTTVSIDRYDIASGDMSPVASGPFVIRSFDIVDDGERIVAAVNTPTRPTELWEFTPGRDGAATSSRVLVSLNDDLLAELDLAVPEVVSVPSTDGVEVEALLVRPPASAAAEVPGPGLIYIHGGPMSAYTQSFFDEFQMAAADGYTVIAGNPRGSDGYGEEWVSCIAGALGEKDWDDVQALTDHLAALDTVDAERIGIGGGSYGGFMTSWAIGHTDRYQAALVERAVTNWETMAGTSDIGSWFMGMLLDADWHTGLDRLRAMSPMTYADHVRTPTLVLHSEEDWRCPIEQAEQFFAVLRRNRVDATFARFPGENHELSRAGSPKHRVERLRLVHDFYARHLLDRPSHISPRSPTR